MKQVLAAGVCVLFLGTTAWAETWAAQAPFSGGVAQVVHAATEKKARALAISACKKVSDSCASRPVVATVGNYMLFVTTCCKVDGPRCHTVAVAQDEDEGRTLAYNTSLKAFVDAGLPIANCWRHRTYSVRTGARLRD
jgi:hypothetical protein